MGDFTPVSGLVGGLLIGLAVALTLLLNGRIAGIRGIVGGLVNPKRGDTGWRVAFVAGLPLGAYPRPRTGARDAIARRSG